MSEATPLQLVVTLECGSSRDAVIEALRPCVAATRAEAGCLAYVPYADLESAERLFLLESWRDEAALDAHMRTDHFLAFVARFDRLAPAGMAGAATIRRARAVL